MSRKLALLFSVALAVVVLDQAVKAWMVATLTTRFAGAERSAERLSLLYSEPPAEGFDGLHFRQKQSITLLPGFLRLRYAENPGAAFGLLRWLPPSVRTPFFHVISLGAVVLITAYFLRLSGMHPEERWALAGLPLVLGGAIGNYVDRIARGFVIDFIEAHWHDRAAWPSFNVADSAICIGVAFLVIEGFRKKEPRLPVPA